MKQSDKREVKEELFHRKDCIKLSNEQRILFTKREFEKHRKNPPVLGKGMHKLLTYDNRLAILNNYEKILSKASAASKKKLKDGDKEVGNGNFSRAYEVLRAKQYKVPPAGFMSKFTAYS